MLKELRHTTTREERMIFVDINLSQTHSFSIVQKSSQLTVPLRLQGGEAMCIGVDAAYKSIQA